MDYIVVFCAGVAVGALVMPVASFVQSLYAKVKSYFSYPTPTNPPASTPAATPPSTQAK